MRAGSAGVRSQIERHHRSGNVIHGELEQPSTQPEAAMFLRDHDILHVVAKAGQVSMRDHHREADDVAAVTSDVDPRLRCDQRRKSSFRQLIPRGLQLRDQRVEVRNRRGVDGREVLEPVSAEPTHGGCVTATTTIATSSRTEPGPSMTSDKLVQSASGVAGPASHARRNRSMPQSIDSVRRSTSPSV